MITMIKPAFLVILLLLLTGCRESAQPKPTLSIPEPLITLTTEPNPPRTGTGTLVITITSPDGAPLYVENIAVRGDMTHAGMRPVFTGNSGGDSGVYRMPFNWSMGGDWIITVTVLLADNVEIKREFKVTVGS
jgi:hypothetical protein